MRINCQNPSFKGYDAFPLKRLYLEESTCAPILPEMHKICKHEKIDLQQIYDFDMWTQDDKAIIERNGRPELVGNGDICDNFVNQMKNRYGIKGGRFFPFIDGGNTYMGRFPDGKKWMMLGLAKDEVLSDDVKKQLSGVYNIDAKNIFGVPKPDFHIDLGIRPIGFPNVLVNDSDMAQKKLEELNDGSEEYINLKNTFDAYKEGAERTYASCDDICSALEKQGFKPIRIAGVFYNGINFMNAIVNKHSDGTMSYISNSSECSNHIYNKLQTSFETELRSKVPNIDNIYFVKGTKNPEYNLSSTNYMLDSLNYKHGGIHCMTLEEPSFEKWS